MTTAAPPPRLDSVLIIGAGPSGLLLALLLSTLSPRPRITILDAASSLNTSPRATHYGPPAVSVLRRAGILPTVRERGFMPRRLCWRKLDGTRIAGFDRGLLHDDSDALTVLSVGELSGICVDALRERGVEVRWGERVVGVGGTEEGETKAWVETEGGKRFEADFVVGCDGGNSAVRRLVLGREGFGGFTWGEQIVATNTYYDFKKFGWEETNFIIDHEHWYMAAQIKSDGLWRVSYGEIPGLTDEQLLQRQPMKFQQMLPGHPTPEQYEIVNISPYRVHQRCVEKMAIGRVLLAADAAHLCNPFGGMGLTSGIVDVEGLFDCFRGIHAGVAGLEILKTYSDVRIEKYKTIVDPVSTGNIKRMFKLNPENALKDDEFLSLVKRAETDVELSRELQNASKRLKYDFTQHYSRPIDT
ncbi:hypothetical protein MBLNU457_7048t1 [Dothideomycetes sp. NU457]